MPALCRFKFSEGLDREVIETHLALVVIAIECTFGQPKVRISGAYCISREKPQVAIDDSTDAWEHIT